MQRHRILTRLIGEYEKMCREEDMANRVDYFDLPKHKKLRERVEIKLLVQVPDNFVQNLIDQTF